MPYKKVFIYEPFLDQAVCIASMLRNYTDAQVIAVIPRKNVTVAKFNSRRKVFHACIYDEYSLDSQCIHVPTGSFSTEYWLRREGSIRLGEIEMTKEALSVFDKIHLLEIAQKAGIPIPKTQTTLPSHEEFPVFCKERFEKGGGKRFILQNMKDASRYCLGSKDRYIYQELVRDPGTYGVAFLATRGNIVLSFTYFERESLPKEGGSAVIIERFFDERLINYTRVLIEVLDYSGWGLVEFKYSSEREDYLLMEINSKFWASCEFAFLNEPRFLELLFGVKIARRCVQKMVFMNRFFRRGPVFMFQNWHYLADEESVVRSYPCWKRALLSGLLPQRIKTFIHSFYGD